MNTVKTIALATLIAAISGFAQAQGVEQFGRGTPDLTKASGSARSNNSVAQFGRGTPTPGAGVSLPSVGANVDVASVQGRSSIARMAAPATNSQTIIDTASRGASDVYGRS